MALMLIASLYSLQIRAETLSSSACILLGPEPSFIIKFHHPPPIVLARAQLAPEDLPDIAMQGITFTYAKRMAQGAYIAHFKIDKQLMTLLQATALHTECYSKKALSKIIEKIKQSPIIAEATPNFLSSIMEIAEANTQVQWNLQAPPGGVDATTTWAYFTSGAPHSTIAVLDTGIVSHEALDPNVLPGVHFTNAGDYGLSARPSCIECAGATHGTMVAGIIAATGEVAYGEPLFGVAPHSTVIPINVFTQFNDQKTCGSPPCIYSYVSDQINALQWLAGDDFPGLPPPSKNIVGINMSFGNVTSCPLAVTYVLHQLQQLGISAVVAAGNQNIDASRDYPANCPNVIAVAATGLYGERASYSNWGKSVTIAAPGGNGQHGIYCPMVDGYRYIQGTSFAAPHVSGVIALLYTINPMLDPIRVKEIITRQDTVTVFPAAELIPVESTSCIDERFPEKTCGAGIINAYKAAQKVHGGS